MSRIKQVIKYSWLHASQLSHNSNIERILIFFDIIYCYFKYRMWSNQYVAERFHELKQDERLKLAHLYKINGKKRDLWQKDFKDNRKFLLKYSDKVYELANMREKRRKAYTKRFNAGKNLMIEYDVNISRQHYLDGSITIGDNVLIAKHVFIDYSGTVVIKDNVQLTNGVIIETHYHPFHSDYIQPRDIVIPTSLVIEEGAVVGSRAIIMPSCCRIGRHSRIGAGAVVTHDVPDYAVVIGVPGKIVRYQN